MVLLATEVQIDFVGFGHFKRRFQMGYTITETFWLQEREKWFGVFAKGFGRSA
jgi:hypothetical protein